MIVRDASVSWPTPNPEQSDQTAAVPEAGRPAVRRVDLLGL